MLSDLNNRLPDLASSIANNTLLTDKDALWHVLERLLLSLAPSGSSDLPGGIGETIQQIADELGFGERLEHDFMATGNIALKIGAGQMPVDVLLTAHMDRPTYRVRDIDTDVLYPICSNRFPTEVYEAGAKAIRFIDGQLKTSATGKLTAKRTGSDTTLYFRADSGELDWQDSVTLAVTPERHEDEVIGTGLDNCMGVAILLSIAKTLIQLESQIIEQGKTLLLVFTDQEEGPPEGFFGHGASRLRYVMPPPHVGFINIDGHNAGKPLTAELGQGASHGFVSGDGRGSVVPLNFQALARDLAVVMNAEQPATVQFNYGYLSRSDDMGMSRWSRVMALSGPPLLNAHTGEETGNLDDMQCCGRWISHYLLLGLGFVPDIAQKYALR